MKKADLEKLKKETTPKKIIWKHIEGKIYLTDKQLNEIIALKNKEENGCQRGSE